MEVALPNWSVKHLSLWTELVNPAVKDEIVEDVSHLEETTVAAQYIEMKSKIAPFVTINYQRFFCQQQKSAGQKPSLRMV